jgi:hypothetical protein
VRSLRLRGVTKLADAVRRELAQPISAARKDALRSRVVESIGQIDRILAEHGTRIEAMPAPTRMAYAFLKRVDFDSVVTSADAGNTPAPQRVAFKGLNAYLDRVLHGLAHEPTREKADSLYASIRSTSRKIEADIEANGLEPRLTAGTRRIRAWLAFFTQRENFDAYGAAVARAKRIFEASFGRDGRYVPPARVHFRPMAGLYRLRGNRQGTHVALPTPMIAFSDEALAMVAAMRFERGAKRSVLEATLGDEYQAIAAELGALGGVEEAAGGVHHPLAASFDRVNAAYFGGTMPRPRLIWSKVFTGRLFGHYDRLRDTVMISCTLDRADVPESVVDFVMYHELLHKKLGLDWRGERMAMHTGTFRDEERRFAAYAEADSFLKRVAGGR